MVAPFLDDLQVPHVHGLIDRSFNKQFVKAEEFEKAASGLTERFGAAATGMYFGFLEADGGVFAELARGLTQSPPMERSGLPTLTTIEMEADSPGDDQLTNLDRPLEQAIAAAAAGSSGAGQPHVSVNFVESDDIRVCMSAAWNGAGSREEHLHRQLGATVATVKPCVNQPSYLQHFRFDLKCCEKATVTSPQRVLARAGKFLGTLSSAGQRRQDEALCS